ncbi:MAG TPA: sulfurtransferase [Vicinamibacterales bacterium]|nr:sulfurtransferase [Vicinamibacterales bacterium]
MAVTFGATGRVAQAPATRPYAHPDQLVDTAWLAAHTSAPAIRIVDLRASGYAQSHIPGAVHVDNAAIRDATNAPTFVPSTQDFERLMGQLGISDTTRVIAYDDRGGIYAARLWWILSYFGHPNVALLDGGWVAWTREARPTTAEVPTVTAGRFTARPQPRWIATATDVLAAITNPQVKIVDARTTAEIEGRDLRGIKRGGAVPSSIPVYWEDALDPDLKTFKPADDLARVYRDRGIRPEHEVIAYCQVGMRASHDLFVLSLIGYDKLRNYYGAWDEWGNRDDLPIKK